MCAVDDILNDRDENGMDIFDRIRDRIRLDGFEVCPYPSPNV